LCIQDFFAQHVFARSLSTFFGHAGVERTADFLPQVQWVKENRVKGKSGVVN
jgi:hypothetical protein